MATRLRNVRVSDEQWARWEVAAETAQTSVSEFVRDAVEEQIARGVSVPQPVTRSGRVLTDEDFQALADEAERGHDLTDFKPDPK